MHTLQTIYHEIIGALDIDTPKLDARIIIEKRAGYGWSDIIANPDFEITKEQYKLIMADMKQRLSGKPLSRIYGVREFWGLEFGLSADTLDPRPDSELIIERSIHHFSKYNDIRILDLGTGSGCLLISLLHEFPNASGVGADISAGALVQAQINAQNNNCASRAEFINSSWLDNISGKFDLIISNPPYISNQVIPTLSKEVKKFDPILALDGGNDGLDPYKIIFPKLKNYLKTSGIALFEIGYDQEKPIMRLAEESRFTDYSIHHDLAGNPRVVDISYGDK